MATELMTQTSGAGVIPPERVLSHDEWEHDPDIINRAATIVAAEQEVIDRGEQTAAVVGENALRALVKHRRLQGRPPRLGYAVPLGRSSLRTVGLGVLG